MFERSTSDARPDDDVAHRCASDGHCVNADVREHDLETGRPICKGALVVDGPLCAGCLHHLSKALKGMPQDYERLSAAIGDCRAAAGDRVHLTRDAPIPINTSTEALMSHLVETVVRGAEMVADAMNMGPPVWPANPRAVLTKAIKMLEPTLQVLIDIEPQPAFMWARVPSGDEGWELHGQPTELVELSGVDVALMLVEINRLVGVQLGKSRLRYHTFLPCPAWDYGARRWCGAMTVGRDDGADRFDCTTCGAEWSEAEYGLLTGILVGEIKQREENNVLRWLLLEAYGRLDEIHELLERLSGDATVNLPGAGPLILTRIEEILDGHQTPEERNPGTEPKRPKAVAAPKRKAIEA